MRRKLGGNRLGSGNKMSVDMHNYSRSSHDMGLVWKSTMAPGTLVPCYNEIGLPGDTFDIDLAAKLNTLPTTGPLFGSYKFEIHIFKIPFRLYIAALHNNKLKIGMNMNQIKLPIMRLNAIQTPVATTPDFDNAQINPSCILNYLGIKGVGINNTGQIPCWRDFNAVGYLSYVDIYKNFYANKQEEIGAVIHTQFPTINTTIANLFAKYPGSDPDIGIPQAPTANPTPAPTTGHTVPFFQFTYSSGTPQPEYLVLITEDGQRIPFTEMLGVTVTGLTVQGSWNGPKYGVQAIKNWDFRSGSELPYIAPTVHTFDLNQIDDMREEILAAIQNPAPFNIADPDLDPYALLLAPNPSSQYQTYMQNQEGLLLKTYNSDLFNNWVNTDWIDGNGGINELTAIDTSGGSFTIEQLNLANKAYNLLMRVAVSGGTYDDWMDSVWTEQRFKRAETPEYCGGLIKEIVFSEVVSNSEAEGPDGTKLS